MRSSEAAIIGAGEMIKTVMVERENDSVGKWFCRKKDAQNPLDEKGKG